MGQLESAPIFRFWYGLVEGGATCNFLHPVPLPIASAISASSQDVLFFLLPFFSSFLPPSRSHRYAKAFVSGGTKTEGGRRRGMLPFLEKPTSGGSLTKEAGGGCGLVVVAQQTLHSKMPNILSYQVCVQSDPTPPLPPLLLKEFPLQ